MRFPSYAQLDRMDCGPTCLRIIAKHYGKHFSAQTLREKAQISRSGVSILGIAEAAESIGFRTMGVQLTTEKLISQAALPAIIHWSQNHFVVLYSVTKKNGILSKGILKSIWGGRRNHVQGRTHIRLHGKLHEREVPL